MTEGLFENPSEIALNETLCYKEDTGGKVKYVSNMSDEDETDHANEGENHGDRVIADALANLAMEELNGGTVTRGETKSKDTKYVHGSFAWRRQEWINKRKKELGSDW